MHSLFSDFVMDEGNMTTVKFTFPTKLPWTTRGEYLIVLSNANLDVQKVNLKCVVLGICAVNSVTALSLDNSTTHNFKLNQDCYTIALADCSSLSRFIVGIKMNTINSTLVSIQLYIFQDYIGIGYEILNLCLYRVCEY